MVTVEWEASSAARMAGGRSVHQRPFCLHYRHALAVDLFWLTHYSEMHRAGLVVALEEGLNWIRRLLEGQPTNTVEIGSKRLRVRQKG